MKEYLELKRQPLPHYRREGLWQTLRHSAKVHGYRSAIWFGIIRWKDHVFNQWAMRCPWNGFRIRLQRWRGVHVGHNVHIGPGCTLLAHSTPMEYHSKCVESFVAPTVIGKNAWVGVNVTILPGVTIGEGAIVGAGAVVTQDLPPHTLAAGVPAKIIKKLDI